MKLTRIHCTYCGGTDIACDAAARWNERTGQWEISGLFDDPSCDDCGGECDTVEVTCELPEPGPVQSYRAAWEIDIMNAGSPQDAAWQAWALMRASDSVANCFQVTDEAGKQTLVDLQCEVEMPLTPSIDG